jgi:hypothetical protein
MPLDKGYTEQNPFIEAPFDAGFKNDGEFITEQRGYITVKDMIHDMQLAGRYLQDYREGYYDVGVDEDLAEVKPDPFRGRNLDPVDLDRIVADMNKASKLRKKAREDFEKAEKEKENAKLLETNKSAEKASPGDSGVSPNGKSPIQ